jgi:hypothetical protein
MSIIMGGRHGRIMMQGQPRQKFSKRPYLKKQAGYGGTHFNLSYTGGRGRRITVRDWPRQKKSIRSFLKNKLKQKGLGVWL